MPKERCAGRWRQSPVVFAMAVLASRPLPVFATGDANDSVAGAARVVAERVVARAWSGAQDVAQFALGLIGVAYRYGGDTPARGLDCSGLIRYVFQEVTGVTLPRTAKELSALGTRVNLADLRPGDLVFFNTRRFAFSHVGLYLGEDRFIHAPRRGREVEVTTISSRYWQQHFDGARRLIGELPALVPDVVESAYAGGPAYSAAPGTSAQASRSDDDNGATTLSADHASGGAGH
jgi:hypothetical protein